MPESIAPYARTTVFGFGCALGLSVPFTETGLPESEVKH
jgi:hypothetical protein